MSLILGSLAPEVSTCGVLSWVLLSRLQPLSILPAHLAQMAAEWLAACPMSQWQRHGAQALSEPWGVPLGCLGQPCTYASCWARPVLGGGDSDVNGIRLRELVVQRGDQPQGGAREQAPSQGQASPSVGLELERMELELGGGRARRWTSH